jgi:hypothetical protein
MRIRAEFGAHTPQVLSLHSGIVVGALGQYVTLEELMHVPTVILVVLAKPATSHLELFCVLLIGGNKTVRTMFSKFGV